MLHKMGAMPRPRNLTSPPPGSPIYLQIFQFLDPCIHVRRNKMIWHFFDDVVFPDMLIYVFNDMRF